MKSEVYTKEPIIIKMTSGTNIVDAILHYDNIYFPKDVLEGMYINYIDNFFIKQDNCYIQYNIFPFYVKQGETIQFIETSIVGCF